MAKNLQFTTLLFLFLSAKLSTWNEFTVKVTEKSGCETHNVSICLEAREILKPIMSVSKCKFKLLPQRTLRLQVNIKSQDQNGQKFAIYYFIVISISVSQIKWNEFTVKVTEKSGYETSQDLWLILFVCFFFFFSFFFFLLKDVCWEMP